MMKYRSNIRYGKIIIRDFQKLQTKKDVKHCRVWTNVAGQIPWIECLKSMEKPIICDFLKGGC